MDASVKKVMSELKAGKYAPVYFLQGEETYYIDLIANYTVFADLVRELKAR